MHRLLLLATVIVAAAAQQHPHMLFTPQNYYLSTEASFSLTTYSSENTEFQVDANVYYKTCTCKTRNRRTCGKYTPFSNDTQIAVPGIPTVLSVDMPSLCESKGREYYISITSHNGRMEFLSRHRIYFNGNSYGFILVKTDKPIYKPGQTVNICVVYLDKTLRPHKADADVEVVIRDGNNRRVLKITVTVDGQEGVKCFDMPMSDEPNLGTWNIVAQLQNVEDNDCKIHYPFLQSTCKFQVDKFVLPKFEVTMDGDVKQLTRDVDEIYGRITAKYTFGEIVQGNVRVNATLEASGRKETLLFYDDNATLVNGFYFFSISSDLYRNKVRYRYDPFCVKSSIKLVAEVTEAGRGNKQSTSIRVPLVANPISVSFSDDNPTIFKPGLPYIIKGKAFLADKSPATGVTIVLIAIANNGKIVLLDEEEIVTDKVDGTFSRIIMLPKNINCLKFTLAPAKQVQSCESQSVCFSPSPMYSPTESFLQITDISSTSPILVSENVTISAITTFHFKTLHLVVIGQGGMQLHRATIESGSAVKEVNATFQVTHAMVPAVKVMAVVARQDGELVADLVTVSVKCELRHTVNISFESTVTTPGEDISITTETSPDSMVVLGVIDKSLTLLAKACKSVEKSNVCDLLKELSRGSLPKGGRCSAGNDDSCCPTTCSEPTKYSVSTIFNAAGISMTTNMFRPNPPSRPSPPLRPQPFFFDSISRTSAPAAPTAQPPPPSAETPTNQDTELRDFFPETWIWKIFRANSSGVTELTSKVPDTITTWNAEAFAISNQTGLGISPLVQLTVKKDMFVSLELPYCVIFGEAVTITPLVFYFGDEKEIVVKLSIDLDDELSLNETNLFDSNMVRVTSGTGTPFSLTILPRAIGRFKINITAVPITKYGRKLTSMTTDTVSKVLFVKPGCERFEITENIYANGTGEHCFNYTLPECAIPGSAKATISVTGDIVSHPNLDRLLVLPTGCGEQNFGKLATNWIVGLHLHFTGQLQDHLRVKIRNNVQIGVQRQLTYLQGSGCFSFWARGECSLWLTAMTTLAFSKMHQTENILDLGLPKGTSFIDEAVVTAAVRYILLHQDMCGKFPITGRVHNYQLMQEEGDIAHTALVLYSLTNVNQAFPSQSSILKKPIARATDYIMEMYNNGTQFCNYGLVNAIVAGAFNKEMITELKSRITTSKNYPGACFLCNECPEEKEEEKGGNTNHTCPSRPRGEGSAVCVETTATALRALQAVEDTELTVCLAEWLVQIKSASGGFYSSQDTVIALVGLTAFSLQTFTKNLDMNVDFSIPNLFPTPSTVITPKNRFKWFDVKVPTVPSTENCIQWSGNGTVIIQSSMEYYGCSCCDDNETFSVDLTTQKKLGKFYTSLYLGIIVSYLENGTSNMVIVDVEMPSGYAYSGYIAPLVNGTNPVERVDPRGSNIVFYLNEVTMENPVVINVIFYEQFKVQNPQQIPVTVYDYYNPDQIVTKYYLPISTKSSKPTVPINTQ